MNYDFYDISRSALPDINGNFMIQIGYPHTYHGFIFKNELKIGGAEPATIWYHFEEGSSKAFYLGQISLRNMTIGGSLSYIYS